MLAASKKTPSKPITNLHITPGTANNGGNGHIKTNIRKANPATISAALVINPNILL